MTVQTTSPTTVPAADSRGFGAGLRVAAGVALVAAPVLWAAGMWTSPPAAGTTDVDYVASLGRDGTLTQVSALFLHYGNLFIGLGVLAAASLLRGPRGSRLTVVGALLTALGFTNMAGTRHRGVHAARQHRAARRSGPGRRPRLVDHRADGGRHRGADVHPLGPAAPVGARRPRRLLALRDDRRAAAAAVPSHPGVTGRLSCLPLTPRRRRGRREDRPEDR